MYSTLSWSKVFQTMSCKTLLTPGWQDYTGKRLPLTEDIKAYLVPRTKGVGDIKPNVWVLLVMSRPGVTTLSAAGQTSGYLKASCKESESKKSENSPRWHCFGCQLFLRHNLHSLARDHLPWFWHEILLQLYLGWNVTLQLFFTLVSVWKFSFAHKFQYHSTKSEKG